ncbi:hypothetical protein A4H97_31185 [Niastella yeongjuensis]|uniref:DUF4265 domain-containing protein n=1 Tax=Niastella yeongjuensis TaxID=354355 RepID=A0A1V9EJ95_9BACT|nr:DUF4265 domain-containing protein [Niastella yeongjuensis]OQP46228.1 hypothetical protein A4H97_31185 [Niastella yeongjuensis]SEP45995.1 protein of unknown function [Niastella yeongjuensis]
MDKSIKVLFVQQVDDHFVTEGLWCTEEGEYYIVDNIPFIANRIALGDTIKVELDTEDNAYYFDDFVAVSGNSTIRVFPFNDSIIEEIRKQLLHLGCESEVFLERKIIAVNVPVDVNYKPVKEYLDNGEETGNWTYEESCLMHSV